jgi:hypothetical protein
MGSSTPATSKSGRFTVFAEDFDANTKSNSVDGLFRADSVRRASAQCES